MQSAGESASLVTYRDHSHTENQINDNCMLLWYLKTTILVGMSVTTLSVQLQFCTVCSLSTVLGLYSRYA